MAKFSWNDHPDVPASTTQGSPAVPTGGPPGTSENTGINPPQTGATPTGVNTAPTTGQTGPATPGAQTQTDTTPNYGQSWQGYDYQHADPAFSGGPTYANIQKAFQMFLGHAATDVTQWANDPNWVQHIWESPEAQQYRTTHAAPGTDTGATTPAGPRDFGDLTDPKHWMDLVGNKADLISWIKQNNPSISDSLADYYAGKIQAQPGANENEQKGSAGYWLGKMKDDPELGGKGSGVPGTPGNQEFSYPSWNETFQAPTGLTEQNDPGWQARMQLGEDALQRSAAAKGSVLDTGTLKDINKYAQDYASNEYGQVYNRAAGEYNQRYGQYVTGFNNALTAFGTNFGVDQSLWNRALTQEQTGWAQQMDLANLGLGATNAGTAAGTAYGAQAGQGYTGIGNANAAGTVGAGNAYANGLNQLANYGSQYYWNRPGQSGGQNPYGYGGTY